MPSDDLLYLRQDVQVEPLVDQWYAWAHLLSPATLARNITHRHVRLMSSYLSAPEVHADAAKDPQMRGGPFIDHGGRRVDEVRDLLARTQVARATSIELSTALEQLDTLLGGVTDGGSLHPLYAQTPAPLRGYVELVYDLRHNPSFRLIEPLLYRSRFHDPSGQSLMLSLTTGDDRPFVLSTPRLDAPGSLHLPWQFDDERIDTLFRLKTRPQPWTWMQRHLDIPANYQELFRTFLTSQPPPRYEAYAAGGVRWRYFGHACILVEARGLSILFDPVLSYTYESDISRYTYADLPDHIDYVVITHNHMDHILLETLLQLRHKVGAIVVPRGGVGMLHDPSLALALGHAGFRSVVELGELQSIDLGIGTLTGIPFLGEHSDLSVATKLAYVVGLGRERLMFAADSCNIEPHLYHHVRDTVGDVGTLFVGMECEGAPMSWFYGPLMLRPVSRAIDRARRLNGSDFAQAIAIVETLRCRNVYVYAMGQEPWLNYVMSIKYTEASKPIVESNKLLRECASRGIVAERLFGEKEILLDAIWDARGTQISVPASAAAELS